MDDFIISMKLNMVKNGKYIRFIILGGFTYVLTFLQTTIYIEFLLLSKPIAYGITQIIIFILNLFWLRNWVFASVEASIFRQGVKFFFAVMFFRFIDWCTFNLIITIFVMPLHIAIFISMATVFPFKYFIYGKKIYK